MRASAALPRTSNSCATCSRIEIDASSVCCVAAITDALERELEAHREAAKELLLIEHPLDATRSLERGDKRLAEAVVALAARVRHALRSIDRLVVCGDLIVSRFQHMQDRRLSKSASTRELDALRLDVLDAIQDWRDVSRSVPAVLRANDPLKMAEIHERDGGVL